MSVAEPPDLLAAIVAATAARVVAAEAREPRDVVERRAASRQPRGSAFHAAVARGDRCNIIAECKRRSPSRGVLRAAYDPVAIAQGYAGAGAAAISVLTEPSFFDGALTHLTAVREAVETPLLRKDFVVSPYQLAEAVAAGADAVLLIVAALEDAVLRALHDDAQGRGLAVLVEVHTEAELDRALAAGARLIGVNNRNLKTLEVDVDLSERLASRIPSSVTAICESGLSSAEDVSRFLQLGYRGFLIGERFMTRPDPGAALAALLRETGGR